ncbi:Wzz/FepE/Etk N-terminal domain-containing protein [Alphaproteobacteria bacterium]|nr:Wzz/FepE/Etk N-terminal domain-containing protein [Alphaproteobacteria bacterium]
MSVNETKYDDEIDLLSLFETIWDGKWKIAFIVAVSLLSVFGFNIVKPNTTFTATTKIKPITSGEFDKYILFNASLNIIENEDNIDKEDKIFNIFEITPTSLLNSYIEVIEEGVLLETGIDKFGLINKDNFDSESDYKDAIEKFASDIEVLKPIKEKKEIRLHHVLSAEYNDNDKWKDLLTFVNEEANKIVKASIISRFASISSVYQQKKNFAIKDILINIDNVKKDYDRIINDRLAFLGEQASIARKLDIQKNTIASQRFNTQNTFVTSVNTDAPFYLRGYVAIEEEIKQITTRKDKEAFNKHLFKLEQQKRDLEQDKTLARAEELFNKTPLNQNEFKATIVKVAATDYKTNNKTRLYYALAIVLGGMIGIVYVLIANAFRNRKNETVSF